MLSEGALCSVQSLDMDIDMAVCYLIGGMTMSFSRTRLEARTRSRKSVSLTTCFVQTSIVNSFQSTFIKCIVTYFSFLQWKIRSIFAKKDGMMCEGRQCLPCALHKLGKILPNGECRFGSCK